MHIIFMYKVGKYHKHSGSESLLLIRGISWSRSRLPEILKFQNFEISETSKIAAGIDLATLVRKMRMLRRVHTFKDR